MDLVADVGGTRTRCALVGDDGVPAEVEISRNDDFADLAAVIDDYLVRHDVRPQRAAIAIAAPVKDDEVRMTNRDWRFSVSALGERLGVERLEVVNDFTAVALSLPHLRSEHLLPIGGGSSRARSTMAALGPGTGLGVSGLVRGAKGWAAISGEGGHVTLAPGNQAEARVIEAVTERFGHCSAERLIAGPGLVTLYTTLQQLAGGSPEQNLLPAEVSRRAARGDPTATQTLEMSFALLGSVAGNLALTLGATGGVFIAGGVIPHLIEPFRRSRFRERFEAKGSYRPYLAAIPTSVVVHPTPALLGLATLV